MEWKEEGYVIFSFWVLFKCVTLLGMENNHLFVYEVGTYTVYAWNSLEIY